MSTLKHITGISSERRARELKLYNGQVGYDDQGNRTRTSEEQIEVEDLVRVCVTKLNEFCKASPDEARDYPKLFKDRHLRFLMKALRNLPSGYQGLDASGPWLCYWIVHAISLLGVTLEDRTKASFIYYLKRCEHPNGGYGGGQCQVAHLATTYGAINCLLSLDIPEAYESIDRDKLYSFLLRMHQLDGSFIMHDGGEVDIRGTYCALSVAKLTNLLTPQLVNNCVDFLLKCQTYEGGFGGLPGLEAHGGYSFCGIAALAILNAENECNVDSLLDWLVFRQCPYEGGFNGRTNKLVDGCYSFWQGGAFPIVYKTLSMKEKYIDALPVENWLFNQEALQEYILACCQLPNGGLVDKPGKHPDFYHTCYVLSGLSIAQHFTFSPDSPLTLVGCANNRVQIIDPVHNILQPFARNAMSYFSSKPLPVPLEQ